MGRVRQAATELERIATRGELACLICHDPSVALDHIRERSLAPHLREDAWNLAPLCEGHHRAKTLKVITTLVVRNCPKHGDCYQWGRSPNSPSILWLHVPVRVNERNGCLTFATDDPTAVQTKHTSPGPAAVGSSGRRLRSAAKGQGEAGRGKPPSTSLERPPAGGSPVPYPAPLAVEPSFYPVSVPASEWCREGMALIAAALVVERASTLLKFEIGDWANRGEDTMGQEAHQFFTAFSFWQITIWASVARRVPPLSRDKDLPFLHHRVVAHLPPAEQQKLLAIAHDKQMSYRALDEMARGDIPARTETFGQCPKCGHTAPRSEF